MGFKVFKRKDSLKRNDLPQVSIRTDTLAFNSELTQKARLSEFTKVKILVDEANYKLGFSFHNEDNDPDSLTLYSDGITKSNRVVSARQLITAYKWVESISKLNSVLDKRFTAKWDNIEKLWIIELCPSFENIVSNESQLGNIKGIYRYKNGAEVAYIGKGIIKSRISSPDRKDWSFDTIEYSIIDDPAKQTKWESFWLDRFANEHGNLPVYNRIQAPKIKEGDN